MRTARVALATSIALLITACADAPPTAPAPQGPHAAVVASCPTTTPVQQINAVITRVQNSGLPADVKARIISGLNSAKTALQSGNRAAAISRLEALRAQIQANPRIPSTLKQELVARIKCIITALSR